MDAVQWCNLIKMAGGSKHAKYTQEQKDAALEAYKTASLRSISRDLGIPFSTLNQWKKNPDKVLGSGKTCVLTPNEEEMIVMTVEYCGRNGFPVNRAMFVEIVKSFVTHDGRKTPFPGGEPQVGWVSAFEKRWKHRISKRKREGLSKARVAGMSQQNVDNFYETVWSPLIKNKEHNLEVKPWLIWNTDETGFQACRASGKVYVGTKQRNAYCREGSATKANFTVLFCGNAVGQYLPPYTVYKGKNLWLQWCQGGFPGAMYGQSENGWMETSNFEAWFEQCFVPRTTEIAQSQRQVLFYDGHISHISFKTLRLAMDQNIDIICLPANTSHALQPLDVGVFKSVKALFSKIVLKWFAANAQNTVDKDSFPVLLKELWEGLKPEWLVGGFRRAGLYPYDPEAVQDKIILDPRDDAPVSALVGPNSGPRSPRVQLLRTIREALITRVTPQTDAVAAKKQVKRKRCQATQGELMTEESVIARIAENEAEKAAKKKTPTKATKAGASAPDVSITIRQPIENTRTCTTGYLDSFVMRQPRDTSEEELSDQPLQTLHNEPIPVASTSGQSSLDRSLSEAGTSKGKQCQNGLYREASTTEDSEADPDDPRSGPAASNPPVSYKNLRKDRSYVIFHHERAHFPGLVTKKNRGIVTVKTMQKVPHVSATIWCWPDEERFHEVEFQDIVKKIPVPLMSNKRGNYHVPDIARYWSL